MNVGAVHMVCGPTGAGKTTYARRLASERGGVRFCLDEWMAALFVMDAPQPITLAWMLPRVERSERVIWGVCCDVTAVGVDVVIELGFFKRAQRDRVRGWVAEAGRRLQVHSVDAPREVRRERVRQRQRGGENYTIDVDDATFAWAEDYYEPLATDELVGAVIVETGA